MATYCPSCGCETYRLERVRGRFAFVRSRMCDRCGETYSSPRALHFQLIALPIGVLLVIGSLTWVALGESFRDDSLMAHLLLLIPLVSGTAGALLIIEAARCRSRVTPPRGFPVQVAGHDTDRTE